uniref:Poly [ADP-ribose] polymerase n=1 Tax=Varanus komodoensis TaxID=61221 RepID=A0A8D2KV27_VARKO
SDQARKIYALCIEHLKKEHFQLRKDLPDRAEHLASVKAQEILIKEAIDSSRLDDAAINFVELIWTEALGLLDDVLDKAVTSISLNDVSRAEGILLWIRKALDDHESPEKLSTMILEFYKIIPHKSGLEYDVNKKLLSSKQDLCQLIRDMLNMHEINMLIPNTPSISKYRALRCKIDVLDLEESSKVKTQIKENLRYIVIVSRFVLSRFNSHLGNIRSLFHASSVSNIVGILSRGLLLPKIATEHGLERSDQGNLGSGIYFSESVSVSVKYAQPSRTDGTRMLLICDVALGKCYDTHYTDSSLTAAPSGYDSVHAVSKKEDDYSEFEHDEFAVYRTSQVKIKYVVQFCLADDKIKTFSPVIPTHFEDQVLSLEHQPQPEGEPHFLYKTLKGLFSVSLMYSVAAVVVFQMYENQTGSPIEAKYVFPLDDTAAVCGFEAFIKEKHIIGEVKEKEEAHREYREAVREGHGAYLMDQDAPDIFTVSVGNLPPSTKVLIKITYITELSYKNGCLSFHLPAAVAPWQQDKALNENTQVGVLSIQSSKSFSLQMSIEMPFKINHINSWTHQLKIKRTDCKAVVCTFADAFLDSSGFALEILIGDAYLPRMWVEKHPNKESEACMLVFQPEFGASFDPLSVSGEVVICLDCSNSMAGSVIQQAKQIALCAVASCQFSTKLSVFKFGTNFEEFPSHPKDFTMNFAALEKFITSATATMGSSDLWKTLRYLNLLYPSECKRNIFLISDGHIQNEGMTLQMVKQNAQHTRIFTCGIGPTANRHVLRSLAQYGAGAFEYFDVKSKYNWKRKVKNQTTRMFSPGCNAISIKWHQFDMKTDELKHAPAQIQALFNNECLLVYGFISRCTQATLNALVDNQELQAMVSTTELQKTTGTVSSARTMGAKQLSSAKKQLLKSWIIQLSQENSIVTQFTSFVAIAKRDAKDYQQADTMDVLELVAKEDVDILPYMQYLPTTQGAPCQPDVNVRRLFFSLYLFI